MKGLLKAFITDTNGFQFDDSRANKPDRYGVTLAYVNFDDPSMVEDFHKILKKVVGLDIDVQIYGRLIASNTTSLRVSIKWPKDIYEEFGLFKSLNPSEALLKRFYRHSHHITEGWDEGFVPVVAAKDMTAYITAVLNDYWDMAEMDSLGFKYPLYREGENFLKEKGWVYQNVDGLVSAKIEWKSFE